MTSWMQILTTEEAEQYRTGLLKSHQQPCSTSSPSDEEAIRYLERNRTQRHIEQLRSSVRSPLSGIDDYLLRTSQINSFQ